MLAFFPSKVAARLLSNFVIEKRSTKKVILKKLDSAKGRKVSIFQKMFFLEIYAKNEKSVSSYHMQI